MITKPKLLYIIGPNFCVNSLARESLEKLSKKYDILCISEGPLIDNINFQHETIAFAREPSLLKDIRCLMQLIKIIYNNKDANKIVISTPKISFIAAIACKLNMKAYVYLHRGAVYQNFVGLKSKIYKYIDRFIIRNSDVTTFISKSLHEWVTNELNLKDIKYNRRFNSSKGVDLQSFHPGIKNLDSKHIVVGFCGRVVRDKGYDELTALARFYRDNPAVVIKIKGKIELNQEDRSTFNQMIANNVIEYFEWDNNVASFFQSIDVLFFPSKREGFGNVLIEAAACGVPSIGFKIPGVMDAIIEHESGILINAEANIILALKKMIDNKKELARLSLQARLSAEANFDQNLVLEDIHQSMDL
jgi:glycosyltransferase involved in cell wall biosynthesis